MSFDLSTPSLAATSEQGHRFELKLPGAGRPLGAFITVRGPRSEAVREMARQRIEAAHARDIEARRRREEPRPQSLDEMDAQLTDTAVRYTMDWEGITDKGAPVPFSAAAAAALYQAHPWIREQVIAEAQDLGNFTGAWSTSSSTTLVPSSPST